MRARIVLKRLYAYGETHAKTSRTHFLQHLVNFKEDKYFAKAAHSEKEVCQLIEVGFEFFYDYSENKVFWKRKWQDERPFE